MCVMVDNRHLSKNSVIVYDMYRLQFSHFITLICYAQNDAIHALIKEASYEDVKEKIVAGSVYQISKFFLRGSQEKYIVVMHELQLITSIGFVEYDQLSTREHNDVILTDLIGSLKLMYPLKHTVIDENSHKHWDEYVHFYQSNHS